jgi:hypothetical protein
MTPLLVLSHVLTALAGGVVGYLLAPSVVESVENHREHPDDEEHLMADDRNGAAAPAPREPGLNTAVVVIIASGMVIVIGVLSVLFIHDSRARAAHDRHITACTVQWGNDLLDSIDQRSGVSNKVRRMEKIYDQATASRDQALNAIIDLVLRSNSGQPPAPPLPQDPEQAFPIVLQAYAKASSKLEAARTELNQSRDTLNTEVRTNPYPVPIPDCKLRKD